MCNTFGLLVIGLVLFLLFKNKNILVIGVIVITLSYYFNYKEGAKSQSQQTKLKTAMAKIATQKGTTVKKVVKKK